MESGPRDHSCIVCRETRRWCKDFGANPLYTVPHCTDESRVARDAAAEDDPLTPILAGGAEGLLDESVDQRVLESPGDVLAIFVGSAGAFERIEHSRLQSTE